MQQGIKMLKKSKPRASRKCQGEAMDMAAGIKTA